YTNFEFSQYYSIRKGFIVIIAWTIFTLLMCFMDIKSNNIRKVTTGQPLIVVKNGRIMENSLRKARLDIDSLRALLRQKNVFAISDVDYAIFETSGKLSVLKKELKQSNTKLDMNIPGTKRNK